MRKFVLLLLIAAMVIVGDSYAAEPVIVSKNDRAVVQMKKRGSSFAFREMHDTRRGNQDHR